MYFELIDFLLDKTLFQTADLAIEYVKDKHSEKYLITLATIRSFQRRYKQSVEIVD